MHIVLLLALFLAPSISTHAYAGRTNTTCQRWKQRWLRKKLLLPQGKQRRLIRASISRTRPTPDRQHRSMIRRYTKIRHEVARLRRCYYRQFRRLRTRRQRQKLLRKVEQTLLQILDTATLPLWIGTPWDFYGTAEIPHQKSIACGYFLVHALRSVGFRFPQNHLYRSKKRGLMRIFAFAKLAAGHMTRILSTRQLQFATSRQPVRILQRHLKRQGPGLYILGLDNHVGLVLYNGKQAVFWHSNYADPQAWVKRENLYRSPVVLASQYRLLAKIELSWYKRWLYSQPIRVKR